MASTMLLQRRIRTAQNVSKTTKAMQMIAASKLKKAQEAALSSRPYVEKLSEVTRNLTTKLQDTTKPKYMDASVKNGKTLIIVISPDKGLCGGLVTNLLREVLKKNAKDNTYLTIGKKGENSIAHLGNDLIAAFPFGNTLPAFDVVYPLIKIVDEYFMSGKVERVQILSTHFENLFTQKPHLTTLLPIMPGENIPKEHTGNEFQLFEPNLDEILPELLNRYIEMVLYQEIIESYLSEQGARMLSMQNATNNAKDIIEDLRLEYNKSRQAKITSELLDITGATASTTSN
jgi:F-type H+-transporting ATPase subunit gamma